MMFLADPRAQAAAAARERAAGEAARTALAQKTKEHEQEAAEATRAALAWRQEQEAARTALAQKTKEQEQEAARRKEEVSHMCMYAIDGRVMLWTGV